MTPAPRPSEDGVWTLVAVTVARRSRCSRAQVGAVVVAEDGRVASTGYNGPPASWEPAQKPDSACMSWCRRGDTDPDQNFDQCPSVHAEVNALLYCDRDKARGGTLYVTKSPCMSCCKAIAAAGIAVVVAPFEHDDRGRTARHFFQQCGIHTRSI